MSQFKRSVEESYGPSSIELLKLNMNKGFQTVNINGKEIFFPVFQVKKYFDSAEVYVFVEKLKYYPVIMMDIIYSYEDILNKFENDEKYRNDFIKKYNRKYINSFDGQYLDEEPKNNDIRAMYFNAIKNAIEEKRDLIKYELEFCDKVKVEKNLKENVNDKENNSWVDFTKAFVKDMFGNNEENKKEEVNYTLSKKIMYMKSGSMLVNDNELSKYFCHFISETISPRETFLKDTLAFYVGDLDDNSLYNNKDYFEKFSDVLLKSNVLEVFSYFKDKENSKMSYIGQYNKNDQKLEIDRTVEKNIDKINETLKREKTYDEER